MEKDRLDVSAFHPDSYAEAVATHKPMSRNTPLQRVGKKADTIVSRRSGKVSGAAKARKHGARKKKVRRVKISTLKRKAWVEFSIFIRTKGADENGFNTCVTCGERKPWKELQAGHFIRGRLNANLFDERGVWPQCYSCNVGAQGNVVLYYKVMLAKFGQDTIDELIAQNNKTRKWLPGELQALFEKYRNLNAANPLVKEKE